MFLAAEAPGLGYKVVIYYLDPIKESFSLVYNSLNANNLISGTARHFGYPFLVLNAPVQPHNLEHQQFPASHHIIASA